MELYKIINLSDNTAATAAPATTTMIAPAEPQKTPCKCSDGRHGTRIDISDGSPMAKDLGILMHRRKMAYTLMAAFYLLVCVYIFMLIVRKNA